MESITSSLTPLAQETRKQFKAALENDLNTAEALAVVLEMVRKANTAMDAGMWRPDKDTAEILMTLRLFDEVFAVLNDDGSKMKQVCDWARAEGRDNEISQELLNTVASCQLSDADIEKKIAEMGTARAARNFKLSDALRAELTGAGIVIENTKDGVRWRRK